jgi:pyridoxal phosphate enzyme (YggS family)
MSVAENLKTVLDRIAAAARRADRDPASVTLVVVTKTVGLDGIRQAVSAGAKILGENRVQEAKEKIEQLGRIADWHLIGHLQTNKAKHAVRLFDLIHTVDSLELAQELDKHAGRAGKLQDVLIEVNIAGETQKAGVAYGDAVTLVREAAKLGNLRVRGLMTMPPYSDDPEDSRRHFRNLRDLAEGIGKANIAGVSMRELSMGMSGDYEVAVEEGATFVRVGTAIFGART